MNHGWLSQVILHGLFGRFSYAGLLTGRNVGPFALVTPPVLSRHVTTIWSDLSRVLLSRPRRYPATRWQATINWALLILITTRALAKIYGPLQPTFNEAQHRTSLLVGTVEWMSEQWHEGELFNHYNWGGYLILRLWPDCSALSLQLACEGAGGKPIAIRSQACGLKKT